MARPKRERRLDDVRHAGEGREGRGPHAGRLCRGTRAEGRARRVPSVTTRARPAMTPAALAAGVEGRPRSHAWKARRAELEELLGDEERMAVAEVERASTDLRAHPTAKEQGVKVGAASSAAASRVDGGLALADREVGAEGDGGVAVGLDADGHRLRNAQAGVRVAGRDQRVELRRRRIPLARGVSPEPEAPASHRSMAPRAAATTSSNGMALS